MSNDKKVSIEFSDYVEEKRHMGKTIITYLYSISFNGVKIDGSEDVKCSVDLLSDSGKESIMNRLRNDIVLQKLKQAIK